MPIFSKELSKVIMTRFRLHDAFLQNKSEESRKLFAKQMNYWASLPRKTKMIYYENLDEMCFSDYKYSWKLIISFLRDKVVGKDRIHLTENNEIVNLKTVEILNTFFNVAQHQRMKQIIILL